ncbi:RNA recognition motif-containing protein, partial [Dimargaris verticillata]
SKTIIVAGVPNDMTKQQIQEEMALLGTFKDLEYPYLTETQNSQKKNLAKLRLVTATVDHAVAVSLALRSWRPQGRKPFIEYSPTFAATQRKLIIHRVPPEFDEAQLEEVLKSFGSIAKVVIPRKGQFTDGRPGYAMVSMADMAGVHQVFNHVDGRDVGGWVLGVSWGLPKELQSQVKWNALDVTKAEAVADDNGNDSDPDGKLASESPLAVAMALRQGQEWRRQLGDTGAAQNGHTLFVQNLAFDTTEQELHERFSQLGELQYVAITKDRNTRLSRGTAFVCFKSKSAADKCIDMASGVQDYVQESVDPQNTAIKSRLPPSYKTVLVPETPKSLTGTELFTFNGRLMSIRPALDRHEAEARVAKAHGDKHVDRRNIYLLREGYIPEDSEQALATPKGDMQKRLMSYAQRKAALKANPNFFLSTTRLSIRNMPPSVTDASLKQLVKDALKNFKQEVSAGKRAPLTAEEQKEGYSKYPRIVQVKVTRDKARIDPKTNKQQSKGFGFVELAHHAHALVVLRYLNNNPKLFSSNR